MDLDQLEPNYEDEYYNSILTGSSYAAPSDDDFNMIFAKPKEPKAESPKIEDEASAKVESTQDEIKPSPKSTQSELGFASGLDVKEEKRPSFNKVDQVPKEGAPKEDNAPKKPVDKTRGGLFTRDEIENADKGVDFDIVDYPVSDAINQMHRYRDAIYYGMSDDKVGTLSSIKDF